MMHLSIINTNLKPFSPSYYYIDFNVIVSYSCKSNYHAIPATTPPFIVMLAVNDTYEYANSAWKNNELKPSHTIEGVLKSSCPVQRYMCITLYLHCDSRRYHSNEEKEQTNQQWPTKYTQKPQNSAKWTQGVLEKISFHVPPVTAVWLTPSHKNYYFDLSYTFAIWRRINSFSSIILWI